LLHVKDKLNEYVESAFDEGFVRLKSIQSKSKMNFDSNVADKHLLNNHIDYQPTSKKDALAFTKQLRHELTIRVPQHQNKARRDELMVMSNEDKVNNLKAMLVEEEAVLLAYTTVERYELKRDLAVALAVEKLVPCILHMKLRVTEKLFHCLINTGLIRYGDGVYDGEQRTKFEHNITECIRMKVLGNEQCGRATQFSFTWSQGNRSVEKNPFNGSSCDKILVGLKVLASTIFDETMDEEPKKDSDHERHKVRIKNNNLLSDWLRLAENLVPMWKLIEQHKDYTKVQILKLHKRCNTFMAQ
jgi:hypothetical protein